MSDQIHEPKNIRVVWEGDNSCGEKPTYATDEHAVYWVDCDGPTMYRLGLSDGDVRQWPLPSRVGTFALHGDGRGAAVALVDGIYDFEFASGAVTFRARIPASAKFFLNDGRCDPQGRFLVGVVNHDILSGDTEMGWVYRLDEDGFVPLVQNVLAANGMAFSPDGRTLYNGCCGSNTVHAHDYDPATGGISNSRIFARIDAPGCYLDGAAIDEEGGYWLPIYGAGKILRFLPDGTLERTIRLPVSRPTMVAFGGDDHATMFFTTAAAQIDPRMGVAESGNGSLWAFEPGFRGLPEPTFRAFSEGK